MDNVQNCDSYIKRITNLCNLNLGVENANLEHI
jgi:hypothetical protein